MCSLASYLPTPPPPVFPSVTLVPTYTILSGRNASLDCGALGNPPPFVRWFQNAAPLSSGGRFVIASNGSLLVVGVALRDAGNYTCMATNTLGSASATTALVVLRKSSSPPVPLG